MASPPPPPTTVRRNPPRRGRPALTPGPTPAPAPTPTPTTATLRSRRRKAPVISRLLDDEPAAAAAAAATPAAPATPLPPPPPTPPDAAISPPHPPPPPPAAAAVTALTSSTSSAAEERLKVYLRIRPLPAPERERGCRPAAGRARAKEQPPPPPRKQQQPPGVCLVATGPGSVALTVPQAKLVDHRRGRTATEVFDGFSAVLPPDSSQNDIFTQVMNPLVDEFLGGKNGLLVAMGPTGSGKTHTVFGTARNPGLVPLTLQKIFTTADESEGGNQSPRYLKDYLEGRKKMTLILNVKPGEDDYADTSYLLRQASPYMKIRYTSLDESSNLVSQKRTNVSLVCQENKKKRKVNKPEPEVVTAEEKELQRVSRSEQIMKNLFNALWTVSKQKITESEVAAKSMQELLKDKDTEILELKKELDDLKSRCSRVKQNGAASIAISSVSETELASDAALDNLHTIRQVGNKESDGSESCSEQTSAPDGGVTHAPSHLDDPSELSFSELHIVPCNLSAQFTDIQVSEKAPMEQSEEEELSSNTEVESIQHDVDIKGSNSFLMLVSSLLVMYFFFVKLPLNLCTEMKQHDYQSSSQQPNCDAGDVSSNQPFLELQGMGAAHQNPDELVPEPERCESMVKEATAAHAHGANEDLCASKPRENTKKPSRRRLLPVSAMMLKEFTGPAIGLDGGGAKASSGEQSATAAGRSDALIRLLKAKAPPMRHHRG
ncbi:hypothetical protein VPH35_092140 [Triticum aestivum]